MLTLDVMCWHAAKTEAQDGGAGASAVEVDAVVCN